MNIYEALYEAHGQAQSDEAVVGGGDFEWIGRIELGLLLMEGLTPTDTLVDFGCGTGRLAVHAIPMLVGGQYIGTDVSPSMLEKAQRRVGGRIAQPPCRVSWIQQTTTEFPLAARSVDMICAFSVFTHIEHEDSYRYLRDALRVVRPGGRFIFSCLPLDLELARDVFLSEAQWDVRARWGKVRNIATSIDLMTAIARIAGWTVVRWYPGDEPNIRIAGTDELVVPGQAACVLEAPGPGSASPAETRATRP